MKKTGVAAVAAAAALTIPAGSAAAGHGHGFGGRETRGPAAGHGGGHDFVFVGTFTAPGVVEVTGGNAFVRRGGFAGRSVAFDLAAAKLTVADTDADGTLTLADVKDGDTVLVKARLPRRTRYDGQAAAPVVAGRLVDRTNPPMED